MPRNDKAFVNIGGKLLEVTVPRCQGCEHFACGICSYPGDGCGGVMRFAQAENPVLDYWMRAIGFTQYYTVYAGYDCGHICREAVRALRWLPLPIDPVLLRICELAPELDETGVMCTWRICRAVIMAAMEGEG